MAGDAPATHDRSFGGRPLPGSVTGGEADETNCCAHPFRRPAPELVGTGDLSRRLRMNGTSSMRLIRRSALTTTNWRGDTRMKRGRWGLATSR